MQYTESDLEIAENELDYAIDYLRKPSEETSVKFRNRYRKTIVNETAFLRKHFPESRILKSNLSDISLLQE